VDSLTATLHEVSQENTRLSQKVEELKHKNSQGLFALRYPFAASLPQ
jgi:hypothetical protein